MHSVRSWRWILSGVVGATVASLVLVYLPTEPAKGAETLRFSGPYRQAQFNETDTNNDGTKVGDVDSGRFLLYTSGKRTGSFVFTCTYATTDPTRQVCDGGIRVNGKGKLFLIAAPERPSTEKTVVGITGGTGRYAGAAGTAQLDFSGRHAAHITVRLK